MSAGRKKRPLTPARLRLSAILREINTLANEFAVVRGEEDDAVEALDNAVATAREVIGDVFDEKAPGEWRIAASAGALQ